MSKIQNPCLPVEKTFTADCGVAAIGIVIPIYSIVGNDHIAQLLWSIEQNCDLPYQVSMGVGPVCVARNRLKGEARLGPDIRYVMHVDDDVLLTPFFASRFVSVLRQQPGDIGVVSATMMGSHGQPQNDLHPDTLPVGEQRDCLPPGTCFMYDRKKAPVAWDTEYQGSQWEDTDAMMQIKAQGFRTVATGSVQIVHKNNLSQNKFWAENKARFVEKWPGVVNG